MMKESSNSSFTSLSLSHPQSSTKDGAGNNSDDGLKEYQTLFWVPMLFQTAKQAENIIDDMLNMISDFNDENRALNANNIRKESMMLMNKRNNNQNGPPKRRQQILGEAIEPVTELTSMPRVDVVLKSDATKFILLTVLKRHFLFSQLRDYELEAVIDTMQSCCATEQEVIIKQGDPGELFYILEEGTCDLIINDEYICPIESGSSFGDLALMYNCPRAATIRARTFCTLWTLDRVFFRQAMVSSSSNQNLTLSQFLQKINLFANISVSQLNQLARSLTKQTYEDGQYIIRQGDIGDQFYVIFKGHVKVTKTDDNGLEKDLMELGEGEVFGERALIKKEPRKANVRAYHGPVEVYYLESHDFFAMLGEFVENFNKMNEFRIIRTAKVFNKLSDYRLKVLISQFTTHRMFSNQRIVCGSNTIFLVIDGVFVSTVTGEKYTSDGSTNAEIGSLEKTADIVAGALTAVSDDGILASFTTDQLLEELKKSEEEEQRKMRRSSYMEQRTKSMLDINAERTNSMMLSPVSAHHTAASSALSVNSPLPPGSSATGGHHNVSSMIVMPDNLDATEKEIRATAERRRASAFACKKSIADLRVRSLDDLNVIQPLGRGTFGNVYLCEHKRQLPGGSSSSVVANNNSTKQQFALKCLSKKAVVENGQHMYVRREIIALSNFQHPFIGGYMGVILSRTKICFVLEYIPGGELWTYLYDESVPNKEKGEYGGLPLLDATLYAANIILALEHIHGLGYTYRDLKPENLLIHSNGYLKLVDFGFAKQVPFINNKSGQIQYRTFTLCGTPDYMAPELILTQGHDRSADYWAYGVVVYELVCGYTPFDSSNQQRTFEKIVHSGKYLSFPNNLDPHCKSLIRRLLHPNAALRLGALQNGIEDIKQHAFFTLKNLNFDALLQQQIDMPYLPNSTALQNSELAKHLGNSIEALDVEFEKQLDDEDEYATYFEHLDDPDFID